MGHSEFCLVRVCTPLVPGLEAAWERGIDHELYSVTEEASGIEHAKPQRSEADVVLCLFGTRS